MPDISRNYFAVAVLTLLVIASVLTQHGSLRINGVAPNIFLVILIVVAYGTENALFYLLVLFFALPLARTTPLLFDPVASTIVALGAVVFFGVRRVISHSLLGALCSIFVGTIITYVILQPSFLLAYPMILLGELMYNLILGTLLFYGMTRLFGRHA